MTEVIRVEQADGSFVEREATDEELSYISAQRTAPEETPPAPEETPPNTLPDESEQNLFTRAKEITNQEVLTTTSYNAAIASGNPALARALLYAGYLAEHYRAFVGNREPTDEELRRYRTLLDDFERLLRQPPDQPYP